MSGKSPMLSISGLNVSYGGIKALRDVSLDVHEGEIVALIGANGAGKTTLLRAISGMIPSESGSIRLHGKDLRGTAAHKIVEAGVAHVPEGRGVFANLTVHENLVLATWCRKDKRAVAESLNNVYTLFPRLKERSRQSAGTLSGGEQQMLAVGRALMTDAPLLLLDEPSMGLSPVLVTQIFSILRKINEAGSTILLVEQNARQALALAERAYVLETGRITLNDDASILLTAPRIRAAYLGG